MGDMSHRRILQESQGAGWLRPNTGPGFVVRAVLLAPSGLMCHESFLN
jgi:hypothetical protein